jgi:hypothetical protein
MPPTRDLTRQAVAVHECGHRAVWLALGGEDAAVRIWGEDEAAHGVTTTERSPARTPEEVRRVLLTLLAGYAAQLRWMEEKRLTHDYDPSDSPDMRKYRRVLHSPLARDLSDRGLRAEVRGLVQVNWGQILVTATRLDRRGRV